MGEVIIKPITDYNILKHKYIKIYLQLICNTPKHVKTKQLNPKLTPTKRRIRYKITYYQTDMNLTKISYLKPPTKNPQNHETEMKTRLKTLVLQAYSKTENACTAPNSMCDKKGGCAQNLCLKSSSPPKKYIFSQNKTPLLNLEYRYIFFIRY